MRVITICRTMGDPYYLQIPVLVNSLPHSAFVIMDMHRGVNILSCSMCKFPAEVEQDGMLPSCFSSYYKQLSFQWSFQCHILHILCFLVISLLKMTPKYRAGVPKHRKVVMCHMEKMYVLGRFRLGMRYSAIGHELNINESTIY